MPIQGRLHMDQRSLIEDIYIDNSKTYVKCITRISNRDSEKDTLNMLSVISVRGSNTDQLKRDFESWLNALNKSRASDEEKREIYYQKLFVFIKKYPKSKISPYLLGNADLLSYAQVKELSSMIDTSLNNSFEVNNVASLLNTLDKSKYKAIGVAFQDFILKDSSGNEIDTKQFRGKYTLIVFWASWCVPCRAEHPGLNLLYEDYKDKAFKMVGVSLDKEKQKWTKAIMKDQLNWTQVIDPNAFEGKIALHYDIESVPANFLLDKEGKILGVNLTPKEIEGIIKKLL